MKTNQHLDFGQAIKGCFEIGLKNVFTVLGASLLYFVTVWIPYLNIGTTIAYFTVLPTRLAKGERFSPTEIFDAKYRENMSNFFLVLGLINAAIGFGLLLLVIPGLVLAFAWMLSPVLVINFDAKPIESINQSYKATYGSKWAIFFSYLLLGVGYLGIMSITGLIIFKVLSIDAWLRALLGSLVFAVLAVVFIALLIGLFAQIIKSLLINDEITEPIEQFE